MFGWMKRKTKAQGKDSDPELEQIFEKIERIFANEKYQNSFLPEAVGKAVVGGEDCDKISGGHGEFGRQPTNPIPVNGPLGEMFYLSQLRTLSGSPVMFHRVGSTGVGEINVDIYEVLSIDEKVREHLFLSLYHPRKSRLCPTGYRIEPKVDFRNPIYGVNFEVSDFPHELDHRIREWQKGVLNVPLSIDQVRKYLYGSR